MTPSSWFTATTAPARSLLRGLLVLAAVLLPCRALALGPGVDLAPDLPPETPRLRPLPDSGRFYRTPDCGGTFAPAPLPGHRGVQGTISLLGLLPQGEFADNVRNGIGLGLSGVQYADRARRWGIRFDLAVATYGLAQSVVDLGLVEMDVSTENDIFLLDMGPQVRLGGDNLQGTLRAFGGLGYFTTFSSVNGEANFSKTHASDLVPSVGLGGDLLIPVRKSPKPLYLDFSVQFRRQAVTQYARKGDVTLQDGRVETRTVRSRTDMLLVGLGIAFGN